MKIIGWISENVLFIFTLFLLAFIPLYPKLPLLDVTHTWVYIRIEDFVVLFALLIWITLLLYKKITFKTPLTMPILIFWIAGAISTLHGVLLIFSTLGHVFPNVAFLNYLRRIEYLSLFFIAYAGMKNKRLIPYVVSVLAITLFIIVLYGLGQKFLGFPAFLTMNEEFAKGIPIRLSSLSRVSSTFGGHYDLAAYLVLVIPLLSSMLFGFKNWIARISLLTVVFSGFILLFMTVSRVSFFVLLVSMFIMLAFHKKRLVLYAVIAFFLIIPIFLSFSTSLLERFGNTIKEVDVLVDAKKGEAIGHIKYVPAEYFKDKIIKIKYAQSQIEIEGVISDKKEDPELASNSALILPFSHLPANVPLLINQSPTGENLPQGTGYVNLNLSPIRQKIGEFFYQKSSDEQSLKSEEVIAIQGNFLIKKALAYDLSFTTRFQGEWPKALSIFEKNIIFGGGYSSTGLAVDNNYFRILGEVGLLGFLSYFGILLIAGIYIKKILSLVDSLIVKSFVFGFVAGSIGLGLNAVFIDVFEASKIAFIFWLLVGITLGTLHFYQKEQIDFYKDLKKTITSKYAVIIYLFIIVVVGFSSITKYYFVGDDFTWLRWVADCNSINEKECPSLISKIFNYFTQTNGFFYRPGTKIYFLLMHSGFWLNQTIYHVVSILLHFTVATLLFFFANKILKNFLLSAGAAFLFVILSGYSEAVFWISSTGFLFNAIFILLSLIFFVLWEEKKKNRYFTFSLISIVLGLLFHELGVVAPLLIVMYRLVIKDESFKELFKKSYYAILFFPLLPYLSLRYLSQSHWFSGDYSYNLLKLPFNILGNILGYLMLTFFGPSSLRIYQGLRDFTKENVVFALLFSVVLIMIINLIYKMIIKKMIKEEQKIIIFGFLFFIISLLPFLGLGNIASRYSYLSSIGLVLLFVFFLKKIYEYLKINDKNVAVAIIILAVSIFSLVHIIQLQQIQKDWNEAGEKSKRFLISFNELYEDYWMKRPMVFYFVNVPIRSGDAWVFPVGLKDAVWLVFKSENIRVYQSSSVEQALSLIKPNSTNEKVFEFDENGKLIERKKPQSVTHAK